MSDIHPGIAISNPDAQEDRAHEDHLTGGGPMTPEQATELSQLALRAEERDAFDKDLSHLEAENRIALLRRKLGE